MSRRPKAPVLWVDERKHPQDAAKGDPCNHRRVLDDADLQQLHLPTRQAVVWQPSRGHEGLDETGDPKPDDITEGVAPGRRRHGTEPEGQPEPCIDVIASEDHDSVIAETKADERDKVVQEVELQLTERWMRSLCLLRVCSSGLALLQKLRGSRGFGDLGCQCWVLQKLLRCCLEGFDLICLRLLRVVHVHAEAAWCKGRARPPASLG
mmetsp:Transcript_26432/g.55365  ORF Transcript_26432/g.55365 Transcript_26432/m.55365 type:complete len:208 (+) Transcript_26432:115-738(+)